MSETLKSEAYIRGLNDAWELTKKLANLSSSEFAEIFGAKGLYSIVCCFSCEEALAKIEAYEKEKVEIEEGDVVKVDGLSCVVTAVYKDSADVLFKDGSCENSDKAHIKKTGKHIDIESLLRQIGE